MSRKRPRVHKAPKAVKTARNIARPKGGKTPRSAVVPSSARERPSWSFMIMDVDGPWCFYRKAEQLRAVIDGLRPYETMTWAEIEGRRDHFIDRSTIIGDAQKRLETIRHDDVDELFSLHLGGKPRVWGIRDGSVLRLLWWDPEHQICPSHLKHT